MGDGVWQAIGLANRSTWIFIGGPAINKKARRGQVLKVEAAYLSMSHSSILALFSGMHESGSDEGGGGTAVRLGQAQV